MMKHRIGKIKRIMITTIAAVCALSSTAAICASAASARTNTYYVYQEKSYGTLSLTSSNLSASTYCEYKPAGRIVKTYFTYYDGSSTRSTTKQLIGDYDNNIFYYNSNITTATGQIQAGTGIKFKSAKSYHKVRVTSYVTWDSAQCDGNTGGYDIPYIVL